MEPTEASTDLLSAAYVALGAVLGKSSDNADPTFGCVELIQHKGCDVGYRDQVERVRPLLGVVPVIAICPRCDCREEIVKAFGSPEARVNIEIEGRDDSMTTLAVLCWGVPSLRDVVLNVSLGTSGQSPLHTMRLLRSECDRLGLALAQERASFVAGAVPRPVPLTKWARRRAKWKNSLRKRLARFIK